MAAASCKEVLDLFFAYVESSAEKQEWDAIDQLLHAATQTGMACGLPPDLEISIGLLTAACPWKTKLPMYSEFYTLVHTEVGAKLGSERADTALRGLQP